MRKFIFVCFALMLLIQVEAAKLKNEKDIAPEKGVENKENINKENIKSIYDICDGVVLGKVSTDYKELNNLLNNIK